MAENGSGSCEAAALWYAGCETAELRKETLPPVQDQHLRVRTGASAISRGTERLVFTGSVPESEWDRMRAPNQEGAFPFPVKYGYANVGTVVGGNSDLLGKRVFALYPHQSIYSLPQSACVPVPGAVPSERAVLAANMETALNGLWDGKPSPGDHICVVGGGVVGVLTAYLCAKIPAAQVTLVDTNPKRRKVAETLGLGFADPENAPHDQDLVYHTSATSAGLSTALTVAGDGADIVEMSWFGAKEASVPLGGCFHSRRLRLVSSQVGAIRADRQARWTFRRRLEVAMGLLADPALDCLISRKVQFTDLPGALREILIEADDVLAAVVLYDEA